MKNKRFVRLLLILLLPVIIGLNIITYFIYDSGSETLWINECYKKKLSYARSVKGKKIIIASGSNAHFGINTAQIEKAFSTPSVNLAVQAGLGVKYILHKVKEVAKPGDIIILPLEYSVYFQESEGIGMNTMYFLSYDKPFIRQLSLEEQFYIFVSLTPFDFARSLKNLIYPPREPAPGGVYTSQTLNKNGDETFKSGHKAERFRNLGDTQAPASYSFNNYGCNQIIEFSRWGKENNVAIILTFPNTVTLPGFYTREYSLFFNSLSKHFKDNGLTVLGHPTDYLFPVEYFYDTTMHLNTEGAAIRTRQLIRQLKKLDYFTSHLSTAK